MISVSCPGCGKSYKLDPALIGKKGRCKVCDSSFAIEEQSDRSTADDERSTPRPAAKSKYAPSRPSKSNPARPAPEEDDELSGLNSASSDGDSLDDLPEIPAKRKRSFNSRDDDNDDEAPVRPKKKKGPASGGDGFLIGGPFSAILSATISGGVGALIWGVIAYFAHVEVGYVAWGIGGLVGFCVRLAAGDMHDGFAGVIAAIGSVVSILAGKLLSAYFIVQWVIQQGQIPAGIAADAQGELIGMAFMHSFGPVDIVFFLLAIATAYKLASGQGES